MKLAASEAFRNLKLKQYNQVKQQDIKFYQKKPFFSMPVYVEAETGVLAPKRTDQVELFKKYTYDVLPALEQSVEIDLLDQVFQKVDPIVRESLTQAYIRKQVEQLAQQPDASSIRGMEEKIEGSKLREKAKIFNNDWLKLSPVQIGKWIPLDYEEFKQAFKFTSPGDFAQNFLRRSKNFSLLMTDEGFKTMDFVDSSYRLTKIFDVRTLNEETFKNEGFFISMFNVLKGDFNAALLKHRKNEIFQRVFATGVNFDALLTVILDNWELVQQVKTQEQRDVFFKSLVDQLLEKIDAQQPNASLPELLFKTVKTLKFGDFVLDLTKYASNPFPVPQSLIENRFGEQYYGYSSTLLFYGDHGAGKSGVLMQAIMYAKRKGWIVAVVPSAYDLTSLKYKTVRHPATGLVMQPQAAQEWLEQFKQANAEHLKTFEIDKTLYGKYNISGVHDDDPDPCPNLYDERRQYHFKDYEKFLSKQELEFEEAQNQIMTARITLKVPNPVMLSEIIDYGISNAFYATNAVYEVMEQLYNTEKYKVLVAVDGINWFYRPSQLPSFRYSSDKRLRGHIPPYHMSMARLFMHFDGHKIKNGTKITASSIFKLFQHDFQPKHVLLPQKYGIKLKGIQLDLYRSFCEYALQTGMWRCDEYQQNTIEQFWMETQGNFAETLKCMKYRWRDH